MAPEKEVVDIGAGVQAARKDTAGNGKSGQQVLSFRSRKLLQSNLSKARDVKDKQAAVAVELPSVSGMHHLERTKLLHGEPTSTKARRALWDSRSSERELASGTSRPSSEQLREVDNNSPIQDEQGVQDSSQTKHGMVVAPSKQELKTPKFKLLETFYEGLEAASCLLRIRHQMCTFRAVCKVVESMSKRRFLLKHLAQIKHIFSEALQLEYVRCQDPDTWGERWDLRITLLPLSSDRPHSSSPLKGSAGQTIQTIRRRKEFHARLLNFESSHPEDGDIPLDPLPRRPNSLAASSLPASPPRDRTTGADSSVRSGGDQEASAQSSAAEDPSAQTRIAQEFEFSIVKRSRGTDTVPFDGSSHFFPSFNPFYSSTQTAQILDGFPVRHSRVEQSSGPSSPLESSFSPSFRPYFSAKPVAERIESSSKTSPEEPPACKDMHEESWIQSQADSRDVAFRSSSVAVNPSSLLPPSTPRSAANSEELPSASLNSSSPFQPSTPVPIVKSKGPPSGTTDKSCPELQPGDVPVSPVPINTPPLQSPMARFYFSNRESCDKSPYEVPLTTSSRDPVAPKSQGTARSLRFASPVRGNPSLKAAEIDAARRTNSLGPAGPSSVNTPPTDGSVVKVDEISSSPSPILALSVPGAPETPSLQTPGRGAHSKSDVFYSPTKRTKLNQRSLFTADKELSGSSFVRAKDSCPKTVSRGLTGEDDEGPQEKASMPSMLRVTSKGKGAIESDLDVLQSLPHDIVQSVWEKERKIQHDTSKELAKQKRRQQMMSGVPKLFNQLRLVFQSLNRSVLPEHELIHTLLASHAEMTDRAEVEERLELVIELAPDYIQTRPSHRSELLYRIDKRADVAKIQRRLSGRSEL